MKALIIYFLFFTLIYSVNSLQCYTCSCTEDDVDQRCATNPELVETSNSITNCNKKYCTSVRVEYLDPRGKLQSISRTCEDKPLYINEVLEDSTFKIYYKACKEDLCNDGNGKDTSGIETPNGSQGRGVLYVPGIGESSAPHLLKPSIILLFISYLFINF